MPTRPCDTQLWFSFLAWCLFRVPISMVPNSIWWPGLVKILCVPRFIEWKNVRNAIRIPIHQPLVHQRNSRSYSREALVLPNLNCKLLYPKYIGNVSRMPDLGLMSFAWLFSGSSGAPSVLTTSAFMCSLMVAHSIVDTSCLLCLLILSIPVVGKFANCYLASPYLVGWQMPCPKYWQCCGSFGWWWALIMRPCASYAIELCHSVQTAV